MIRTTMICIGPSDQSFPADLFHLFDRYRLTPVNLVSIRLDDAVWVRFQMQGSWAGIVRLKAGILSLSGVDLCSEPQMVSMCMRQAIGDGLRSLGLATSIHESAERRGQTFKGLQ
jgi:hypothetical protein